MHILTTVKNTFTALVEARPVSHLAAITLLGTSIYAVHEGADAVLPAGLTAATTAAMLGAEWLQWTALGRLSKIDDAYDDTRAMVLKGQCAGIGIIQVTLYTLAVTNFAHEAGLNWGQGWALMASIGFAALFAGLNFVAKYTSCDAIEQRRRSGPTGGHRQPAPESIGRGHSNYNAEDGGSDVFENVLRLTDEKMKRDERARAVSTDADRKANHRRAQKRIQTRNARALAAQEAARAVG